MRFRYLMYTSKLSSSVCVKTTGMPEDGGPNAFKIPIYRNFDIWTPVYRNFRHDIHQHYCIESANANRCFYGKTSIDDCFSLTLSELPPTFWGGTCYLKLEQNDVCSSTRGSSRPFPWLGRKSSLKFAPGGVVLTDSTKRSVISSTSIQGLRTGAG